MSRPLIIGVVGAPNDPAGDNGAEDRAKSLGGAIASAGAILLSGGGEGVVEAAVAAANRAGGNTIAILPSARRSSKSSAKVKVDTRMGDGRNFINAYAADVLVALPGGAGTLSEIALALKLDRPVIHFGYWSFLPLSHFPAMQLATTPDKAVALAFTALHVQVGERLDRPIQWPDVPDQRSNGVTFKNAISNW